MSEAMDLEQMKLFAVENDLKLCVGKGDLIGFQSVDCLYCPHCGDELESHEMLTAQDQTGQWSSSECWECDRAIEVCMIPRWHMFDVDADGEVDCSGEAMWMVLGALEFDWYKHPLEW